MNKTKFIFILLLFSQNIFSKEVEKILIKGAAAYQLNPVKQNYNDKIFESDVIKKCLNSSNELKNNQIDMKIVNEIINKKINSSRKPPTISCGELIVAYRRRI